MTLEQLVSTRILDDEFAQRLYANLCNLCWYDYINDTLISYSWRSAGSIVADLRNKLKSPTDNQEDYMDWYCSGNEGIVHTEIEQLFNSAGIVLFENFYESYEDLPHDEKIELYKRNNPQIVSYNRDKQLGKIL